MAGSPIILSRVSLGILAKASSVGAKRVKGPGIDFNSWTLALSTALKKVLKLPAAARVSYMFVGCCAMAIPKGTNTSIRATKAIFTFIILPPGEIYVRIVFYPVKRYVISDPATLGGRSDDPNPAPLLVKGNQER